MEQDLQLREMRYRWRQPVRMSNARLVEVLEPDMPLKDAVMATLEGMGCFGGNANPALCPTIALCALRAAGASAWASEDQLEYFAGRATSGHP